MKSIPGIAGIILIVVGVISLTYGHFSYTTQDEVIKVGEIKVTAPTDNTVNLPPVLGGICLALGIGLILLDRFKK